MGSHYSHLTLDDRYLIFRLWETRLDTSQIANRPGRHRSPIHREVRHNWYDDAEAPRMSGYFPTGAHDPTAPAPAFGQAASSRSFGVRRESRTHTAI